MKIKFTQGFLDDCERLGLTKSMGWSLKKIYLRLVPYNWRPGQVYYRLKCFFWHRYTTVKPQTLPFHTWCDKDDLLFHCCFEILTRFAENELGLGGKDEHLGDIDWDSDDEHKQALAEIKDLYQWWQNNKQDLMEGDDAVSYSEQNRQLHRLIEVRKWLWT